MSTQRWLASSVLLPVGAALVLSVLAAPNGADAQAWMSDRSRREGPGFRLGDFELHPGIGVEVGYDSNLYYSDDDRLAPTDSGILRATAHVDIATRGQQRREEGESGGEEGETPAQPPITFRGGLSGSFYTFFNDLDRSNMGLDANLAVNILPGRAFSLSIADTFSRGIRPFTENTSMGASFARISNDASLQVNLATAGDVFKVTAGYNFRLDFFEDDQFQYGNRFQHAVSLSETFRFLPQTALVHRTQLTFLDYFGSSAMSPVLVNNGILLNSQIGVNGAITQDFSVLALVGYGAGFFDSAGSYDVDYESLTAQVQARWQIEENIRLTFGYDRGFQPSFVGNFFRSDRGSVNYQMLIDGAFLLGADVSFGYYEFGSIVRADGSTMVGSSLTRGDFRLIASLFAEYRFTEWLGVNASVSYTGSFTDYAYNVPVPGMMSIVDPAGFNKFQAWGGVRVFY